MFADLQIFSYLAITPQTIQHYYTSARLILSERVISYEYFRLASVDMCSYHPKRE